MEYKESRFPFGAGSLAIRLFLWLFLIEIPGMGGVGGDTFRSVIAENACGSDYLPWNIEGMSGLETALEHTARGVDEA